MQTPGNKGKISPQKEQNKNGDTITEASYEILQENKNKIKIKHIYIIVYIV